MPGGAQWHAWRALCEIRDRFAFLRFRYGQASKRSPLPGGQVATIISLASYFLIADSGSSQFASAILF
jgi:hypothetical protein